MPRQGTLPDFSLYLHEAVVGLISLPDCRPLGRTVWLSNLLGIDRSNHELRRVQNLL